MKTLLKNCYVLCGHEVKYTNLVVEDSFISYIGDDAKEYDIYKDMNGALLMPGLVDAHGHGPMTLLRGVGGSCNLDGFLGAVVPVEDRLTPDDMYIGENWAIIEMLAGGITITSEMYDFPWRTWDALVESGMKGKLSRCGLSFSPTELIPPQRYDEIIEFIEKHKDETDKVRTEFSIHSEYLSNELIVKKIADANRSYKLNVNIHVSETSKEHEECKQRHGGMTPVEYFDSLGVFENPAYLAHCVWCSDHDFEILASKNASIVHNPTSNLKLGSGIMRLRAALDAGVNVALGTDGVASNNNLNMFEEMHLASLIHNGLSSDATCILPEDVIDMATINGAKALGYYDTGVLMPGKKADIIAVNLDTPHLYPALDIMQLITYSAQASDVVMTMVDGKILYENGQYSTMDVDKAKFEMAEAIKRIYK